MDNRNLVRDSLMIFAIVVLGAYAFGLTWNLFVGATPSNQAAGNIVLVVGLVPHSARAWVCSLEK
jgi:hypothetical protein